MAVGQVSRPSTARGEAFDVAGDPTDLGTFFRTYPSFLWGPVVLASVCVAACHGSSTLAGKLADGRAAPYGWNDTMEYTVFAILATFAAHGYFCVFVAQQRQLQAYEPKGKKVVPGEARMAYIDKDAPRGAAVRSTATLLTSWVYALYPFGAATSSWSAFIGWTFALAMYWDVHFFIFHKLAHENRRMYILFHKLHHRMKQPDVFGAYFVTYQSHVCTEQIVLLLAAFAGLPRDVFSWTMFLGTFDTCVKHSGHSIGSTTRGLPMSYETFMTILNPWSLVFGGATTAEHDWHHEKFTTNYALSFQYLDKLFGSYHPGREAGDEVGLSKKALAAAAMAEAASDATDAAVPSTAEAMKAGEGVADKENSHPIAAH